MSKESEFKKIARDFQKSFTNIIEKSIYLSNGIVSEELLESKELVTNNTLKIENKTSKLSRIHIDSNVIEKEMRLQSGTITSDGKLLNEIDDLNNHVLHLVESLTHFKTQALNEVLACEIFTVNYPLLFTHMINEAKMYHETLSKLQRRENITNEYLYKQEMFWNRQMKEHAEFIRGLLDPTERDLIIKANKFAMEYEHIMEKYKDNPDDLTSISLEETINFKGFKEAGSDGILNCKIKSIIIPLLADHVLRKANHFIRLMKYNKDRDYYY